MSQKLTPGFVVAHSHRLEDLTSLAMQFMSRYPLDPLAEDTVLVQSNGIAQWLKINLAQSNGIAAMLNVTLPARFVWQAYRAVLGNQIPKTSPFDKDRLAWRIMRILPGLVTEGESVSFKEIANYLKDAEAGTDQRKLYQLSHRIADLFDQYQNYRADWLDHWSHGRDYLDHESEPVPASDLWQPQLWRALVQDIGSEQLWTNRAALHRAFVVKAKSLTDCPAGMPARVVVFGISSLPQQSLEVLDAIKGFTQVVLCVHNPCKHYWANIVDGKEALKEVLKYSQRRHPLKNNMAEDIQDEELHQFAHPLLASWGKQGRDYIHLLDLYDETLEKQAQFAAVRLELFDEQKPENLLQQLQNDVLNLRPLSETRAKWPAVANQDSSIQFHSCHSVQREVEVLHDQLLQALAEDSTLRPRDIMVMMPDANTYAPHVSAVFGRFEGTKAGSNDKRYIPFTITDQGQRHQQPLLVALELLLTLDQSRVTQTDVLSLLAVPAVQARFDLTEHELTEIQAWLNAAGARWGLDASHRSQFGMAEHVPTNSWWFALERMVFGYMMGRPDTLAETRWRNIEPYHEVAGLGAAAAGKLVNVIEALNHWWYQIQQEKTLTDWFLAAEELLDIFFIAETDEDTLLIGQLRTELLKLLELANESDFVMPLNIAIFREAWLSRLDQPQLHQRFLAGAVNFATLMPMRAIPFRHIYVLGMNDNAYPRQQPKPDFDLMAGSYRPGDRARREDDKYLFLEALLSARDRFSVSWLGRSAQDNSKWPPSVLVAQLREHLAQGWRLADAEYDATETNNVLFNPEKTALLQHLTTEHKLQAFSEAYFQSAGTETQPAKFFTYASEWLTARQPAEALLTADIPARRQQEGERLRLTAKDLDNFLRQAAQPFFNKRLNTYFSNELSQTSDSETFSLDGLSSWQLRNELQQLGLNSLRSQLLQGAANNDALNATLQAQLRSMQREGRLGVYPIADYLSEDLLAKVGAVLQESQNILNSFPQPVADIVVGQQSENKTDGWVIADHATQLFKNERGELLQLIISASEKKDKYLFYPYVKHLLLSITAARQRLGSVTTKIVFTKDEHVTFPPLTGQKALELLTTIMTAYQKALQSPEPLVGELAMFWLNTYYEAISGKLKEGNKKLPAMTESEARDRAELAVQTRLKSDKDDPRRDWPYALRVGLADTKMQQSHFIQAIIERYAPIVRLLNKQLPAFKLPEAETKGAGA